jgi:hypothetical protein
MTTTLRLKPKAEPIPDALAGTVTLQEQIDTMIAEAIKRRAPSLSAKEQRKKNQAAIEMLDRWDEEDKTDDPEELARREAEWQEFKNGINENSLSGRIIYPAQDYP